MSHRAAHTGLGFTISNEFIFFHLSVNFFVNNGGTALQLLPTGFFKFFFSFVNLTDANELTHTLTML